MKKLLIFIFLLVIVAVCSLGSEIKFFNLKNDCKVELFVENVSSNLFGNIIKNGDGYVVSFDYENYEDTLKKVDGIYGESFIFNSSLKQFENISNQIKKYSQSRINEVITIYGYVAGEDKFIYIDGQKVNIQLAFNSKNNVLVIGFPIILGSY